jgi:hypothetical protein
MSSLKYAAVLLIVLSSYCVRAQYIGTLGQAQKRQIKFENTVVIAWTITSDDPNAKQVEIFDRFGHSIMSASILRLVPEARDVSIYDVSARPEGIVAIAAVYGNKDMQVRPAAALLTFDFGGRFLSAFALASSRQISRLEIDEQSNIWTLTHHAGSEDDPSGLPLIVEYTSDGLEVKTVLTRGMFPFHARRIEEGISIGVPSMGHYSDTLWFWLPGSTDLVMISTADGSSVVAKTGLPNSSAEMHPYDVFRMPSGDILGQFNVKGSSGTLKWAYYTWSPLTESWSQFKPSSCEGDLLIGVDSRQQLYLHYGQSGRIDICVAGEK